MSVGVPVERWTLDDRCADGQIDVLSLAESLRLTGGELLQLIGGGWQRVECPDTGWGDSDLGPGDHVEMYVAGEPVQVVLVVPPAADEDSMLRCHCAEIAWDHHEPRVTPGRLTGEGRAWDARDWLPSAVSEAQRLRRQRFRWCPLCRVLVEPEAMEAGVCHGCMTTYLGAIF